MQKKFEVQISGNNEVFRFTRISRNCTTTNYIPEETLSKIFGKTYLEKLERKKYENIPERSSSYSENNKNDGIFEHLKDF